MNISHDTAQVLSLLRDGKARSTRQLTFETHSADPRSCIRNLRNNGVRVADYWVKTDEGKRYKMYYIPTNY